VSSVTPTRSALLELQEERRVMQEGYQFLDEKRLLLAAEMLAELPLYGRLREDLGRRWAEATAALTAAVARHGLQGLWCYPPADLSRSQLRTERRSLLGVVLQEAVLETDATVRSQAVHPSPEAETCRAVFLEVLSQAAAVAALASNLERLREEYRQTERRARALENVLLPEIEGEVRDMDERLEEFDREDAVRSRHGR
jgi:V/A-type H+/Na+-transporting ATPase subunit D